MEHPQPGRRRAIEPRHGRVAGLSGTLSQARQGRPGPLGNRPELSQPRPAGRCRGRASKQFLADPRCRECKELPEAQNLLGRAYQSQKDYTQALAAWREFLAKYPAHKAWSEVQQAIVETEYLMACEQFAAKKYAEANKLFGEFLAKYPLDARSPAILLLMNQQNVAEEKWDEAISAWRRLVSKYPGTNQASRAQFLIGATLEQKLGKLEEALEEYRKVTWGSAAGDAQVAAARLTAKTMTVSTERVFRSDETPKLKLVTRNIESVTVRAYKVDLETYFRKMHLARGVEGLDISLIDPDATFEFKVPKYVKHQEIESQIEVPLPGKLPRRRDGRDRQQQGPGGHDDGHPERSGRDREEFPRRGLRLRREHAHRQAVARRAAAGFQRPRGDRRRNDRRPRRVPEELQGFSRHGELCSGGNLDSSECTARQSGAGRNRASHERAAGWCDPPVDRSRPRRRAASAFSPVQPPAPPAGNGAVPSAPRRGTRQSAADKPAASGQRAAGRLPPLYPLPWI